MATFAQLQQLQSFFNQEVLMTVTHALVALQSDCYNADYMRLLLNMIQIVTVLLLLEVCYCYSITPVQLSLLWLPVGFWVKIQIASINL